MLCCAQVVWSALLDALPMGGKNGQQIVAQVLKQVKTYRKLLNAFSNSTRSEAALIVHVQVHRLVALLPGLSVSSASGSACPARCACAGQIEARGCKVNAGRDHVLQNEQRKHSRSLPVIAT